MLREIHAKSEINNSIIFLFIIVLLLPGKTTGRLFAEDADIRDLALPDDKIEEIVLPDEEVVKEKVRPVLEGKPVEEIPEKDRHFLFLAEKLYPDQFNLFYRHGEYLAKTLKDYSQAIPRLKKAIELDSQHRDTWEILAFCHEQLKQVDEEIRCWESMRDFVENASAPADPAFKEKVFESLKRMAEENGEVMYQGKRFIIYIPQDPQWEYIIKELTDERLDEVFVQVTEDMQCIPAARTSILILDPEEFKKVTPVSWAGGFAAGSKSMTVPADKFKSSTPETVLPAKPLLIHEFTHNIVFILSGGKCPTWLNEGLATFEERKNDSYTEFIPLLAKYSITNDSIPSIAEMEKKFAELKTAAMSPEVGKAYFMFYLYTRFLIEKATLSGPCHILNALRGGVDKEQALKDITGLSVPEFERSFRNWVGKNLSGR